MQSVFFLTALVSVTLAQQDKYTTPIPILKQLNRHNEDGSYSYGYEGADGSFKIETKFPNGEVQGKYGYIDDTGNRREIEYGASKRGFEPVGTDINVPPPTLNNNAYPTPNGEDDGQYREDPKVYEDAKYNSKSSIFAPVKAYKAQPQQNSYFQNDAPAPAQAPARPVYQQPQQQHRFQYQEQPQQQYYQEPQQPAYQPQQPAYQPQPQQQYYQPKPSYRANEQHNIFQGHPAQNIDINTGSYTIQYGRR